MKLRPPNPQAVSVASPNESVQSSPSAQHPLHSGKPLVPRDRLLRLNDVERLVGAKKSTIYKLMKEGRFPPCRRITARMVCWSESAVLQWVQDRLTGTEGL